MHLADTVTAGEDSITVDGKEHQNLRLRQMLTNCPWGELGVDVVLECYRILYIQRQKLRLISMQALVKLLSPLQLETTLPTIVYNVNHETLDSR